MIAPALDTRAKMGKFPIEDAMCWNHMTPSQQTQLAETGVITIGQYGGGPCNNKASVRVRVGNSYGPRFYCAACAEAIR